MYSALEQRKETFGSVRVGDAIDVFTGGVVDDLMTTVEFFADASIGTPIVGKNCGSLFNLSADRPFECHGIAPSDGL